MRLTRRDALGTLAAGLAAGAAAPAARDAFLDDLARRTFAFFWETTNPANGLAPDRWPTRSFASMAAVGFALTAYPVGVERGFVARAAAARRTLATLRFLHDAPQGEARRGMTGYRGFFYHFVDMARGHRFERSELSTIDTALLVAGALFAAEYFDHDSTVEREIGRLAQAIYARVDWRWAERKGAITLAWTPEEGFSPYEYRAYSEAMLLYILALGAPGRAATPAAWEGWAEPLERHWGEAGGQEHVRFPPMFGHQYSHIWIDFRGIRDAFMRRHGLDYFENSRRATLAQRAYAVANPMGWKAYGSDIWGLTACDGPADVVLPFGGRRARFKSYSARGPGGFDDGTLAPTAAGGSIAFAPGIAIPALAAMRERYGGALYGRYGFVDAFNPSFPGGVPLKHGRIVRGLGWFDTDYLGIDQGPIIAMLENHRTGLIWRVMRRSPHLRRGLARAGFTGGWLAA